MKKITKKSILQKITISILSIMLLFNFIVPTYSHADFGGVLLSPVVDLLCSIGDAVINILQFCLTGEGPDLNFSMSAFLVEDDEFWTDGKYDDYKNPPQNTNTDDKTPEETIDVENEFEKGWFGVSDKYHIPVATYSPEQIFAGTVPGLDINFINPNKYTNSAGEEVESSASKLQPTIATWYVAIRNLAVVGLLSVLAYIGIRIIVSSTAADKSKYKQMLVDWVIALCILFFMHYLMSFIITLTESVCTAIAGDGASSVKVNVIDGSNGGTFYTNLLGLARFKTQYKNFGPKMAYLIMYLALVIYTVTFTIVYLKRLLTMAFLTLIAPAVALTYPIDKMNDGQAQAFNSWLKEYIFNALIQPFHLIIYYVFVTSAMDLASTNIIYMIATLAFIKEAEKILRKFFGFDKAGTLGALGGFAAASLMNKIGKGKSGGGSSGKGSGEKAEGQKPTRFEKGHDVSEIEGGNARNGSEGQSPEPEENEDKTQEALDKYEQEGFGQNANGEYYNPWTDEYDPDYDPTKDAAYMPQDKAEGSNDAGGNEEAAKDEKVNPIMNWGRAHGLSPRNIAKAGVRGVGRTIKGATKFATKTAFKAGVGTLAGAVALAGGGGLAGASAAFMAGSRVGGNIGNVAANVEDKAFGAVGRVAQGGAAFVTGKGHRRAAFNDAVWGGTAIGRELDLAHGNSRYARAGAVRDFKRSKEMEQYIRDQLMAQNDGKAPTTKEVREKMNSFEPYLREGMTDIKEITKAQKVAEKYNVSDKQSAIIASIGKEKEITKDVLNDEKKSTSAQNNLKQDFVNKGYSAKEASKQAAYTMEVLKAQKGVANNLDKQVGRRTKQSNTKK